MRSGAIVLFVLLYVHAFSQVKDSVMLREVIVFGIPEEKYLEGADVVTVDSLLQAKEMSSHLGDLMSTQLPIYFRNYGSGMVSGISLRGTSPQHTVVRWNGIAINSFSLGQTDFSILPSTVFEEIKLHSGGGSARFGSGAFGGTILLNSTINTDNAPVIVTHETGSFGKHFSSARIANHHNKWQFGTKLYHLVAENDFKVLSTGVRQPHANFFQYGFLQDISYDWSSQKVLTANYWYHCADRNIQPNIGKLSSTDEQQDKNHRLSVNYKQQHGNGLLNVRGGFTHDVIIYNRSKSAVDRTVFGVSEQLSLFHQVDTEIGAEVNYINADIEEYNNSNAAEYRYDFTASLHKKLNSLALALNLRQPVIPGLHAPFLPYLGLQYDLIKRQHNQLLFLGNVSRNYRAPTFNERYWQNAGDRNLDPEISLATEVGWRLIVKNFSASQTAYTQRVDNWILWIPSETGNYRPQNVKEVSVKGLESRLMWNVKVAEFKVTSSIAYQYVQSQTTKTVPFELYALNKQLIYTPFHTGTASVQLQLKKISLMSVMQYSGKRFTDSANTETYALPAYALINLYASWFTVIDQHRFDLGFTVRNLLNEDYKQYAGRAMPGRNYSVQLTYQLNNKSK